MNDYIAAASLGCIMTTGGISAILGNSTLRPTECCLACLILVAKALPSLISAIRRELRLEKIYTALEASDSQEQLEILLDPDVDHTAFLEAADAASRTSMVNVPILLFALEQTLEQQSPGWSERAEALLKAIELIADEDAVPTLRKMIHVQGIGINQPLKRAIRRIEPRSRLLMPTFSTNVETSWLLRYPNEHHCVDALSLRCELRQMS